MDIRIQRMLRSYAKEDPPPNRVKPVPIAVLRRIFAISACTQCAHSACLADMIGLAFFFLLRPGEYTHSSQDSVPFELKDVQLFQGTPRLDLITATDAQLLAASFGSLTFDTPIFLQPKFWLAASSIFDPTARRLTHLSRHTMTPEELCSTSSRPISLRPCKMLFDSLTRQYSASCQVMSQLGVSELREQTHSLVPKSTQITFAYSVDGVLTKCSDTSISRPSQSCTALRVSC